MNKEDCLWGKGYDALHARIGAHGNVLKGPPEHARDHSRVRCRNLHSIELTISGAPDIHTEHSVVHSPCILFAAEAASLCDPPQRGTRSSWSIMTPIQSVSNTYMYTVPQLNVNPTPQPHSIRTEMHVLFPLRGLRIEGRDGDTWTGKFVSFSIS